MIKPLADLANLVFKSKKRNENTSNVQYNTISLRNCKKTLENLKKSGCSSREASCAELYLDKNNSKVFYIKDEKLSKVLFEKINGDKDILNKLSDEFNNMEFIAVKKQNGVFFIVCRGLENYGNTIEIQYVLSNFYNIVSNFCDVFSTQENKIYVNYSRFFYYFIREKLDFITSLIFSITLDEYNFDFEQLIEVVNTLLYFSCSWDCEKRTFVDLKELIQNNERSFYQNLRKGVFIQHDEPCGHSYSVLPVYLYVNIFRLAINEKCFDNLTDFFDSTKIEEFEQQLDEEVFIFDEELFINKSNLIGENELFVQYKGTDNDPDISEVYLKLKDPQKLNCIKDTLDNLNENGFLCSVRFMYSLPNNNIYINYCMDNAECVSLSKAISQIGSDQEKLSEYIWLVYETFYNNSYNSYIKKNLFFDKNTKLIDTLAITQDGLVFNDVYPLCLENGENRVGFEFPLVIMQVIEEFLNNNYISKEEIYQYNFIKMLPAAFVNDLINYISTKSYTSRGMIKKMKNMLHVEYKSRIEFLENIQLDDTSIIRRTSFFDETMNYNETIQNINKRKADISETGKSVSEKSNYISLDDCADNIFKGEKVCLSESSLERIFYNSKLNNKKNLLIPEKVIISKKFTDGINYQIIGVIWNKSKLYSLSQLIKDNKINVINIYRIVLRLLKLNKSYGYSIEKIKAGINSIFLNTRFDVVFDCSCLEKSNELFHCDKGTLKGYYDSIMSILKEQLGRFLTDFPYFDYEELVERYGYIDEIGELYDFECSINKGFEKCKIHGKWYLRGTMCPECKKIYIVDDKTLVDKLYEDCQAQFFETFDQQGDDYICAVYPVRKRAYVYEQTKLGIQNNLYQNFTHLVPQKLVISKYSNDLTKDIRGIAFNDEYDFEDVIRLDSFKEIQRLKVILVLYKKVLPYILDKSFISTDINIFTTMFMDKYMKGEIIIPNITLLDSKIILSSDEKEKEEYEEKTKKVFSEFLCEYILSDETLSEELKQGNVNLKKILDNVKACEFDTKCIKEYLSAKDAYCKVHGVHYSGHDVICPKCIEDGAHLPCSLK